MENKGRAKSEIFGKRYENATLSNLWWSHELIEKVHKWTKNPNCFLVLLGSSGTGKTHLCAALWEWRRIGYCGSRGYSCWYIASKNSNCLASISRCAQLRRRLPALARPCTLLHKKCIL